MDTRKKLSGIEINPTSEELNLMPESNRAALFGLSKGLTGDVNHIISGVNAVVTSGVGASVSDGFIYLNGEILKVDAMSVPKTQPSDFYRFVKFDADGDTNWNRAFRDGLIKNVYLKTRAVIENVAVVNPGDLLVNGLLLPAAATQQLSSATQTSKGLMSAADKLKLDTLPTIPTNLVKFLARGSFLNVDIGGGTGVTSPAAVNGNFTSGTRYGAGPNATEFKAFFNNVGTSSYIPIVTYARIGEDSQVHPPVYIKSSRTPTSMALLIREDAPGIPQNIDINVMLVEFPF